MLESVLRNRPTTLLSIDIQLRCQAIYFGQEKKITNCLVTRQPNSQIWKINESPLLPCTVYKN